MSPRAGEPQAVRLRPAPHCLNWQQDPQANARARFVFYAKTKTFSVAVDLVAQLSVFNPFGFFLQPAAEKSPLPASLPHAFEAGAGHVTGYALPLLRNAKLGWLSVPWFFRAGRMFHRAGDSPMDLRHPLDQQPSFAPAGSIFPPNEIPPLLVHWGPRSTTASCSRTLRAPISTT